MGSCMVLLPNLQLEVCLETVMRISFLDLLLLLVLLGSVIEAELQAIRMGIQLAKLKGFQNAEIESDSLAAVRFVKDGCSSRHPLFNLISDIQYLLLLERGFGLEHVQVADSFAKNGLSLDNCSRFSPCIPYVASNALRGICFPRVSNL